MDQAGRRLACSFWFGILVFSLVCRTRGAKPAFVVSLVNSIVAFGGFCLGCTTPQFTDTLIVKRFAGAHEDVVTTMVGIQAKLRRHLLIIANHVVGLFFGSTAGLLSCTLNVDPVLVGAGKEKGFNSLLPFMSRNCVRHDHRVEMTKMRQTVGVVDGRGDVESVHLLNDRWKVQTKKRFSI